MTVSARLSMTGLALRAVTLFALLGVVLASGVGTRPVAAAPSKYFVDQTGHVLADPFLSQWINASGMERYGLPITDRIERNDRLVQYFEYAVLAAKSTSKTKASEIAVGSSLLAATFDPDRTVAGKRVGGDREATAFVAVDVPDGDDVVWDAKTGHSVRGMIKGPYDKLGGAKRFGAPLSEAFTANGNRQQWFEFGRIQIVLPEKTVNVAPVGAELANAYGVDTRRSERGSLPLFSVERYRVFVGDGTIPEAKGSFAPVEIVMPSIGVDARIEQIGIVDGVMQTPVDAWNVGWYPVLSSPGDRTNVVMSGHRDWWGIGPTVFWDLDKLVPGDTIYLVGEDGTGASYVVTDSFMVDSETSANDVIGDVGKEVLTLITCDGAFDGSEYLARRIVRAERF